ncbi:MAG: protein kinase domain-containing protein, partial [Acidimicrobiales bacterium]
MATGSIGVLGPIEVHGPREAIDLGGRRQRRLLAALSANAPDVVSVDRLAEIVWEGTPSAAANRTLQTYVSRLRRSLEEAGTSNGEAVTRAEPGYCLAAGATIDAAVFEQRLTDAINANAAGDPARAVLLLDEAERLWRGGAYAEFADEEWIRPEVERLEELRVVAVEERVEARLALGAHAEVIAELQRLVADHPLRERPRRQLMLALYRAGRQAESLRSSHAYREVLAEIGLEPTDEFSDLESQVAAHAPELSYDATQGRSLRGYQLFEELGTGSFATVMRGTQPSVGREVAIKVIRAELANRPQFIRAFETEAQLVARLEHPYIVPLYDFWREPGRAYLVMRLMRGGRLESRLTTHPLSFEETKELVTDIGSALTCAHRAGVVHRDVKSANVLLDGEGNYYLGDFGIAMEPGSGDDGDLTQAFGSPAYASPEQVRRQPVGTATDIYGFGVRVFEALTGTLPFESTSSTAELESQIDTRAMPPISSHRAGVPEQLDAVLRRATATFPTDRHPDVAAFVAEVVDALSASINGSGTSASESPTSGEAAAVNPYKGLRAFTEADASDFHGRNDLVAAMLERLDGMGPRHRLVTVIGPSGSGKSSAVRAGLIPAVREGRIATSNDWFITTMTPGSSPYEELEAALLRVAVNPPQQLLGQLSEDERGIARSARRLLPDDRAQLLLVVDQFEELFVMTPPEIRHRFLAGLAAAIADPRSQLRVVATLRADFYDRPLSSAELADLTKSSAITVTPLAPNELEQ